MARYLIATMPITGHFNPMVSIARALTTRGHEVWWYAGSRFQAKVEATGAHFVPMQAAYDYDDLDLNGAFPGRAELTDFAQVKFDFKRLFIDAMAGQVHDLEAILRAFPADALLSDIGVTGTRVLSERAGLPWAVLGITYLPLASRDTAPGGTGLLPSTSAVGRLRNRFLNGVAREILFRDVNAHFQQVRSRLKLPPFRRGFLDSLVSPYLYLQPTIPAFEYPRSDLPSQVHFVGPILPEPAADFTPPAWWSELLDVRRPLIHVTQGTSATDSAQLIVPTLQALATEDVLVVATTGGKPVESVRLDPFPANARVERFIPYIHLLPHVSVMITNGGYGGVQSALANGVPLIVAGTTEDKPEIANRIAWSGVGLNLKTKSPTPAQIQAAVRRLVTEPRYRKQAQALQAEMASYHAPVEAAMLLEELAMTEQPVVRRKHPLPRTQTLTIGNVHG